MNFSEALKAMKIGSKVSREAWRGLKTHLYMIGEDIHEVMPDGSDSVLFAVEVKGIFADDWWIVT